MYFNPSAFEYPVGINRLLNMLCIFNRIIKATRESYRIQGLNGHYGLSVGSLTASTIFFQRINILALFESLPSDDQNICYS